MTLMKKIIFGGFCMSLLLSADCLYRHPITGKWEVCDSAIQKGTGTQCPQDEDEKVLIKALLGMSASSTFSPGGEINIQVSGVDYLTGSTYDYGSPASPTPAVYTIQNLGTGTLTLLGPVSIGGVGAAFFSVSAPPGLTSIPAGGSTTFQITVNGGSGPANFMLLNNDDNEAFYIINMTACWFC